MSSTSLECLFLSSVEMNTISKENIDLLSEDSARRLYENIRWSESNGHPVCIHSDCGCSDVYIQSTRNTFSCVRCGRQFSSTSKTSLSSRKISFKDYITLVHFYMSDPYVSFLKISHSIKLDYKTVWSHLSKYKDVLYGHNGSRGIYCDDLNINYRIHLFKMKFELNRMNKVFFEKFEESKGLLQTKNNIVAHIDHVLKLHEQIVQSEMIISLTKK